MSNAQRLARSPHVLAIMLVSLSVLPAQESGTRATGTNEPKVDDIDSATRRLRQAARGDGLPREGFPAPDFTLELLEGSALPDSVALEKDGRVRLSAHRGKKPVVLIFGSYT